MKNVSHLEASEKSQISMGFRDKKNKAFFIFVCTMSGITMLPLFFIIWELLKKGYKQLNFSFFTEVAPTSMDAMLAKMSHSIIPGGVLNGIAGSLLIIGIAILFAIPVGILTGIYLSEKKGTRFAGVIRFLTDLVQGIPSIVIGIIAYAWVVKPMHSYSALAGSVALAIMMLPLVIRSTEETLNMLPSSLKEAGLALGASYTNVILKILLPSAFGGLFTGILLSVSRIMGETAPLMLTALGAAAVNWDWSKPTSSLPLLIWEFYNDPNLIAKQVANKWRIQ